MRKIFTLLAGVLLATGVASADIVKLQPSEVSGSPANNTVTFKSGYTISGDSWSPGGGNEIKANSTKYYKFSQNKTYTISIPEGRQVTKVTITGGTRSATKSTYLAELNYITFGETDYVFPMGIDKELDPIVEPVSFTIEFDVPATGAMSFVHKGTESLFNFELTDEEKVASESGLKWSVDEISYKVRGNADVVPTFENPHSLPVTFSSNDTDIAEVDEAGKLVLKNTKEGVAKVSAKFDGNATYPAETIVLTVTVLTNKEVSKAPVEGLEEETVEVGNLCWTAGNSGFATAGEALYSEAGVLTVTAPFAGKYVGVTDAEYSGHKFDGALQLRTASAPDASKLTGSENSESTSFVLAPEKDMKFYLFARRQTVKKGDSETDDEVNNVITVLSHMGVEATDGKAIHFIDQADPTQQLDYTLMFGKYTDKTYDYAYTTAVIELKAGHTYTVFASGTTIQANGFGYTEIVKDPQSAPITWSAESVEIKLRDPFTAPVLVNEEELPVTFASSDDKVAAVSEEGVITLVEGAVGTAVITATYDGEAEGAEYNTTKVSVTITVSSNVTEVYAWAEAEKVEALDVDELYTIEETSGNMAAGTIIDNDLLTAETVYAAAYNGSYGAEYLGHAFPSTVQVGRVDAAPTEDNKNGTEKSGNSPLIVTAKKNVKLVMFMRRQALVQDTTVVDDADNNVITRTINMGMSANDGKGVRAVAHSDISKVLDQEFVIGNYIGECKAENNYLNCAVIWNLNAGETYTIFARGTTISMQGLGYVALANVPSEPAPIAWSTDSVELKVRDTFTAPVLVNEEKLPVTFASSDEKVATVSEEGVITLVEGAVGTVVITATYDGEAEGAEYLTTEVSTSIIVNSNIVEGYAWVACDKGEPIEADEIYSPEAAEGKLAAGTIFDNDALKAETVYEAAYNVNHAAEYLGQKFAGAVQIGRVDAAPTEDNKYGTEKEGSSPLIVTAKKDVKLIMFIRRQGVVQDTTIVDDADNNVISHTINVGFTTNDGKGVRAVAHSDISTPVEQEIVLGHYLNEEADGENDYLNCAVIWNLKAGETYTIYARGTTISMHGLGYVAEKSGLEMIEAAVEGADVEYYNLQGVRVDNPAAGQVVIRRQGNTVTKVVIR